MYLTWNTLFILLKAFHHWNWALSMISQSFTGKLELFWSGCLFGNDLCCCHGVLPMPPQRCCEVITYSLNHKQLLTNTYNLFGFCKPKSVCLFFLYKWEKEGKGEMGGRRLAHPTVENQKGLWSVICAPLEQLCTDPSLRNRTGPY